MPQIIPAQFPENLLKATIQIMHQKVVAFATETVYGLGADATNDLAVSKIFHIKNRPTFNPLIVHYASLSEILEHFYLNQTELALAEKFWPGPLTLILQRRKNCPVSLLCSNGLITQAVRIPNHPVALDFIKACYVPLAAPSANLSNSLSPTEANHVSLSLKGDDFLILDSGKTALGIESTIIHAESPNLRILRFGSLSIEQLQTANFNVDLEYTNKKVITPGMLQKHYAPLVKLRLNADNLYSGEALLAFGKIPFNFKNSILTLNLSVSANLSEAAGNLFRMLWELDRNNLRTAAVMPIPNVDLGRAINERLQKASYNI